MSEKEEVLRQISEIKNHLIDKKTFFPYNYNACHAWAVIALVLTVVMVPLYEYSVAMGTGVVFTLIAIGFLIEGSLTKKVNERYDIDECTKRQHYIMKNFLMIALFLILLTTLLASHKLYAVIYLAWLFLISLGYFAVGFVLNIKKFTEMANFNMALSLLLLLIGIYLEALVGSDSLFLRLTQAVVIVGLALLPSWIALRQQREERKECGV